MELQKSYVHHLLLGLDDWAARVRSGDLHLYSGLWRDIQNKNYRLFPADTHGASGATNEYEFHLEGH
jgi:hypothetical protein